MAPAELGDSRVIVAADRALGHGSRQDLTDVVYLKPEAFDASRTVAIAQEVADLNRTLVAAERPYVLIGFGRWGSSDPWLGVPVAWGQIAGAKVIVEAATRDMSPDPSQGAHFFHNLIGFGVYYLTARGGTAAGWTGPGWMINPRSPRPSTSATCAWPARWRRRSTAWPGWACCEGVPDEQHGRSAGGPAGTGQGAQLPVRGREGLVLGRRPALRDPGRGRQGPRTGLAVPRGVRSEGAAGRRRVQDPRLRGDPLRA